jgi:Ca2+-binding RTX toxin-like protein
LLASSQGDNTFAAYTREGNNEFLGRFAVGNNGSIDSVQESDGADVINVPLGANFPFGLFVTQDGDNLPAQIVDGENVNTNFKLVPWENIVNALPDALTIDTTSYNPRNPANLLGIQGGVEDDTLYGTDNDDTIYDLGGNNTIYAGEGNNTIYARDGNNTIFAGAGDDIINAGVGNNIIFALEGNNTITSSGVDTIFALNGSDRFILGEGAGVATIIKFDESDRITLTGGLTFSNLNISQNGNDTLISAGTDLLATLKYTQSSTITSAIFA